jgi:hypothetical protein
MSTPGARGVNVGNGVGLGAGVGVDVAVGNGVALAALTPGCPLGVGCAVGGAVGGATTVACPVGGVTDAAVTFSGEFDSTTITGSNVVDTGDCMPVGVKVLVLFELFEAASVQAMRTSSITAPASARR